MLVLLPNHNLQLNRLAGAEHGDADLVAGFAVGDQRLQRGEIGDLLARKPHDDVARLDPGFLGRPTRLDPRHLGLVGLGVALHAQVGTGSGEVAPGVALHQPVPDFFVDRNRHVHIGVQQPPDAAVDADHLAVHVEQRPARIASDQGAIGGDGELVGGDHAADPDDRLPLVLVAAGMACGDAPLADFDAARLGHLRVRPFARR